MPGGLHLGMFVPALENLGHADLNEKWLERAYRYEIIGTYAQTEMGHGTCTPIVALQIAKTIVVIKCFG